MKQTFAAEVLRHVHVSGDLRESIEVRVSRIPHSRKTKLMHDT